VAGRSAALHGLEHAIGKVPDDRRCEIEAVLSQLSHRDRSRHIRSAAASLLGRPHRGRTSRTSRARPS
jgi:hypothetical protein